MPVKASVTGTSAGVGDAGGPGATGSGRGEWPSSAESQKRDAAAIDHAELPTRCAQPTRALAGALLAGGLFPIAGGLVVQSLVSNRRWDYDALHSTLEAGGGVIAIALALVLLAQQRRHRLQDLYLRWMAAALGGMGLLDLLHGAVEPGRSFVWFHSMATLAGGIGFVFVWLPNSANVKVRWAPPLMLLTVLASAVLPAALGLAPTMTMHGEFTVAALVLNGVGGVGFLAASIRFLTWLRSRGYRHDLLSAVLCELFGAAAVLFGLSRTWDLEWWWWHLLRSSAYVVAFYYSWSEYRTTEQRLEQESAEREAAQRRSQSSESLLRVVLESVGEAIIAADARGIIVMANQMAHQTWDMERGEMIGGSLRSLMPPDYWPRHAQGMQRYADTGQLSLGGQRLEMEGLKKDGTRFPIEIRIDATNAGPDPLVTAAVRDITERKRAEEALRRSEKLAALGTLAAGIAHEVNNPVTIITAHAELMLGNPDVTAELAQDLHVVLRHAQRIGKIVNGLLALTRHSPGTHQAVDVNAIVDDTLAFIDEPMRKRGVAVDLQLDRAVPAILGDPIAIQQVILNLFTNALEAMPGGGALRIATGLAAQDAGRVGVTVSDTGPGMPPEVVAKIFEPFFSTKPRGTGLGLAVSYGIVHEHRGTIDVQSKPGAGTSFVLTFPIAEAPQTGTEPTRKVC